MPQSQTTLVLIHSITVLIYHHLSTPTSLSYTYHDKCMHPYASCTHTFLKTAALLIYMFKPWLQSFQGKHPSYFNMYISVAAN